jgi:SAM-dependent methyltransferase
MHPARWVPDDLTSLLDVGCNAGELLADCRAVNPALRVAGVDVNAGAVDMARRRLPDGEFSTTGAEALPFADASFDCVTCIEVLEHVPAALRSRALSEIRRVLKPGGLLILRVPHAGAFDWLDPNNFRFRAPGLYRRVLRRGTRDDGYAHGSSDVVWHHHFSKDEILDLLGAGWSVQATRTGGAFLCPLADIFSWPFYRLRRIDNPLFGAVQSLANFDLGIDYGTWSFDVLFVLRRDQIDLRQ